MTTDEQTLAANGAGAATPAVLRATFPAKLGAVLLIAVGLVTWAPVVWMTVLQPRGAGNDLVALVTLNLGEMMPGLVVGGVPIVAGVGALVRQPVGQVIATIVAILLLMFLGFGALLAGSGLIPFDPMLYVALSGTAMSLVLLVRALRRHER